ncbi:RING finger and WD repeat domain-containing protein 3 [Mortierella claussenii]|nr:RING finger and WD repeat domain-containing protein 3 [Mortierella claussenii]
MDDFNDVNEQSITAVDDVDQHTNNSRAHGTAIEALNQAHTADLRERLTLSQDPDFQSQAQVVVRPNIESGQASVPEPRPQNVETERKDVRRIWSKSVVVEDTAGRDEAVSRAKKEHELRIQREHELMQSRMAFEMLKTEMSKLQKKHDCQRALKIKYRTELHRFRLTNPTMDITRRMTYTFYKTIGLPAMQLPRAAPCMSYRQDEETLIYTRQNKDVHGISKMSMRDLSSNLSSIIPIHSLPICDIQCYTADASANKALVLTASMDKALKVTSVTSDQTVLSYDLGGAVTSCCWSAINPFIMYCSVKSNHTSLLTLDLRNANSPVTSFSQPSVTGHSPIHSMTHIAPSVSFKQEGILCGNLEGAFMYNSDANVCSGVLSQELFMGGSQESRISANPSENHDWEQRKRALLRIPGASCSSVSFDSVSRHWMASYKLLGKPITQHVRGQLIHNGISGEIELKSELKVSGGPPVPGMSRTSVFSRDDGSVHMAAGSDGVAYVWHGALQRQTLDPIEGCSSRWPPGEDSVERVILQSQMPSSSLKSRPIKDVKSIVVGYDELIATLSDHDLELYRWSETIPRQDTEDITDSDDSGDEDSKGGSKIGHAQHAGSSQDKDKRRRIDDEGTSIRTVVHVEEDDD